MAQDLTVNIKTTSDVPQAMDKAKAATVSFSKQVDDIGKKFSMAFKDIAFAFVAPLVILNSAISAISGAIDKAKQDTKDILDLAAKGESKYVSRGSSEMARAAGGIKQRDKEMEMGSKADKEAARAYLDAGKEQGVFGESEANKALFQYLEEGKGKGFGEQARRRLKHLAMFTGITDIAGDTEMQDVLSRRAAMFNKGQDEPAALAAAAAKAAETAAKDLAELKQFAGRSKPGEIAGYGNVIGVGSNIAIEMAQMQIDELKRHTELLQMIATKESVAAVDFSKGDKSVAAPSRAKLLSGK
jgi:hypothetical protein